jgi:hypothetical protein
MAQVIRLALAVAFFPLCSLAAMLELDPARSTVEFLAVGRPSMIKIKGKGAPATGSLDLSKKESLGEIQVDLDQFDTGIGLRDQHMKEKYLETKDPAKRFAKLSVTRMEFPPELIKSRGEKAGIPFQGILSFHGESKEVAGLFDAKTEGGELTGNSKFQIKLTDYKVEIPSYLGVKVADMVDVDVSLKGKLKESVKSK